MDSKWLKRLRDITKLRMGRIDLRGLDQVGSHCLQSSAGGVGSGPVFFSNITFDEGIILLITAGRWDRLKIFVINNGSSRVWFSFLWVGSGRVRKNGPMRISEV